MQELFNKIRKYNLWDLNSFNNGYIRTSYLNNIKEYIGNKLIKVFVGQRRVGKSYILRQIMAILVKDYGVNPKNIFYLNKEYLAYDKVSNANDLSEIIEYYKAELKVKGKIYIFIDEVQNIDNWESFVNSYSQDFTQEYEIFISGSNSKMLSGELSSLLSGRYIEFRILPFDLFEYADYNDMEINRETFISFINSSGLPELFNIASEEAKVNYVSALRNSVIIRDILYRFNIKDVVLLDELFAFISLNIGNLTSVSSIIKYYKSKNKKTNFDTISNYLGYLCDTYIISEVEKFNIKGKQLLGGERKYYLNDLGFKNYLFGVSPNDIGNILENFIYNQLLKANYVINVGVWNDNEIDFVATKNNRTVYIQVAYLLNEQKTIDREFGNLLKINDNHKKIVVSLDEIQFTNFKGIKHLLPWQLQKEL